ncbi:MULTISPECIES: PAS-domain containing protein [unclassified Bradyrhizobium]|uniref:PAS-domain containing protein n=1 Tax=unclassified Bradyrhizobium TaxID=2631580 RepID=UPI002013056A|nr:MULTISPECIES: PAS-domain containing protein [unclassified Bradyrhizobium]
MATAIAVIDRRVPVVVDPASLGVGAVALSAALGGTGAGFASALIAIVFSAWSLMPAPLTAASPDLARLVMIMIATLLVAIIVGLLRIRFIAAMARERERRAAVERLSGALDQMEVGVVLLDADTRAQFINRAYRQMFRLSDEQAASRPPFVALMYHGRDIHAYEIPEDEVGAYISARIAEVRSGDPTPVDLRLSSGQVLRFRCAVLPDGGRMLTYIPITDLIRRSDNPADRDRLIARRTGDGDWLRGHAGGMLGAAE